MNGKSIATFALICLFASIKYAGCATIYILTSASNPCPSSAGAEQCTTLQQFASNPGQSVGSNLTMILENGTHALTTQFALNNLYNWTLITTDATILCSGMHYQLQFRSIEHIVIDGVTFQSCGYYSNIHNLGTSISIANSRFLDCGLLNIHSIADSVRFKNVYSRSSFAMSIRNVSKLTIENSTFENGQGHFTIDPAPGIATHMVITDSNFHGGTSEAIRCHLTQSSTVFISGCNFTSNLRGVYIRGAVTTLVNSNFTKNGYAYTSHWGDYSNISNCLFQGSYSGPATNLKGTMTDCLLVSNTRGALVSNDLVVIRTMFVNNTEEYRGAVLRNDVHVGSFTFIQCSFINNTALRETGGAIYFSWRNANLTLIDSTFHHNSAASCGALHVNDLDNYNMHVNIIGCTFTHNQATMELTGGGVACFENAFVSVQSSEFSHNSAALHCGVFCAENSTINVSECTFINNSAAYDGGVFYGVINPSIYNITRSVFAQNRAYDDGGVMYLGQSGNLATITSSNFTMNAATDRGGVVALTASTFQIFQSNMINNTANKGSSINACNAAIIAPDDLQNTTDPTNFMCTLYNGNMNNFNTSTPTNEVLSTPLIPPSSEVFSTAHIYVSADSTCPGEYTGEPCYSLEQFATDSSRDSSITRRNLTLLFEDGIHKLTSQMRIENFYNLTMVANSATILCSGMHYQLQFRSIEHIVIDGVTFQSCGYYSNIHNLGTSTSIANSRFLDCGLLSVHSIADSVRFTNVYSRSSFAMSIRNVSKLTIENSTFEYGQGHFTIDPAPRIATHMVITDSNFHGGTSEAIRCHLTQSSTVYISGCNFTSNLRGVYIRGAVTTLVNSNFTNNGYAYTSHWGDYSNITNCLFQGSYSGRAANLKGTMTDCLLVSNTRGALVSNDLVVTRTMFANNTEEYRGAVLSNDVHVGSFTFIQCSFINNTCTSIQGTGGVIYFSWRNANLTLIDSIFHHNSAASCGTLHVDDLDNYNMHVNIIGCTFTHNQATMELTGGGAACFENAFVSVQSSEFNHNSAALHGGALVIENSTVTMDKSIFLNNSATVDGGVIYNNLFSTSYNIKRCVFSHSSAGDDGGVMYVGGPGSEITVSTSNFSNNDAIGEGGVIHITGSTLTVTETNIYNNSASRGESISACNSIVRASDLLPNSTDPIVPTCTLYDAYIDYYDVQLIDSEVTTTMEVLDTTTTMEVLEATTTMDVTTTSMEVLDATTTVDAMTTMEVPLDTTTTMDATTTMEVLDTTTTMEVLEATTTMDATTTMEVLDATTTVDAMTTMEVPLDTTTTMEVLDATTTNEVDTTTMEVDTTTAVEVDATTMEVLDATTKKEVYTTTTMEIDTMTTSEMETTTEESMATTLVDIDTSTQGLTMNVINRNSTSMVTSDFLTTATTTASNVLFASSTLTALAASVGGCLLLIICLTLVIIIMATTAYCSRKKKSTGPVISEAEVHKNEDVNALGNLEGGENKDSVINMP